MIKQKKLFAFRMKVISICALFGFFLIWYLVTEVWKLAPETLLPSPLKALETGITKWNVKKPDGSTLPQHIFSSLRVSLLGFCFGAVIGVPLGIMMAWWEKADMCLKPVFDFVRTIPPIAWIPIMIILLGIGVVAKASIVFLSAFIPCVVNSYTGIKSTKKVHIWVGQTFGASKTRLLFKVAIPSALPYIFTGLKVSLNSSWGSLVAAEMLGSDSGLGYMIQLGRLLCRADLIIVGMVVIGIMGTILSAILDFMEMKLVKGVV
ncbi:ABC transporter permease [Lachnospiraceae bacterium]|nr:ABC transporter permease [Lachnospiraceae bacterium]